MVEGPNNPEEAATASRASPAPSGLVVPARGLSPRPPASRAPVAGAAARGRSEPGSAERGPGSAGVGALEVLEVLAGSAGVGLAGSARSVASRRAGHARPGGTGSQAWEELREKNEPSRSDQA